MRPDKHVDALIIDSPDDVDAFLQSNNLTRSGVLAIRDAAYGQFIDCSPLMAKNAPGTLAYHFGVLELRVQFLGDCWETISDGGIEGIISPDKSIKIVFQNVDLACQLKNPQPRSEKGAEAERGCQHNLFEFYGVAAPEKVRVPKAGTVVIAIMVDERGAVEVSRPVIEDKKFSGFVVRAFVSDGDDFEGLATGVGLPSPAEDFDVPVRRRA